MQKDRSSFFVVSFLSYLRSSNLADVWKNMQKNKGKHIDLDIFYHFARDLPTTKKKR